MPCIICLSQCTSFGCAPTQLLGRVAVQHPADNFGTFADDRSSDDEEYRSVSRRAAHRQEDQLNERGFGYRP